MKTIPHSPVRSPYRDLVLVVESDPDECARTVDLLEAEGYRVLSGSPGDGGELLERFLPDVLVASLDMPRMSGWNLLKEVHRVRPRRTRVVFTSALADWDMLGNVLEAGGDDLLPKPCAREVLLYSVRQVLTRPDLKPLAQTHGR